MTVPLPSAVLQPRPALPGADLATLRADTLPFVGEDVTVGVENEFQVAIEGRREQVDLPLTISGSRYYQNLVLRARRGDLPPAALADLDGFLDDRTNRIWENSWVRFPRSLLGAYAAATLAADLRADKSRPHSPLRADAGQLHLHHRGEVWLRLPVSYLLKLSLAEALGRPEGSLAPLRQTGEQMMTHLICDNCSPEVTSFVLTGGGATTLPGRAAAAETSRQFFLLQLLVQFANQAFALTDHGQTCHLYLAPNPPARQKRLNDLISDQFYRELFCNPCLSGWDRGEEKKSYMALCHQALSRSQLHTIARLREAGIIVNNLVVLPNTSSTSLANNGTHITLGSRSLTRRYRAEGDGRSEKHRGDLVIKIVEHFLPLFVTTCTAAPFRVAFDEFHPEKVLGYLPHELEASHLRMLWRRWKKKAANRCCGHSLTPLGPPWLDRLLGRVLGLRGDYLPDVRLLDYLVALPGVDRSPALDGRMGNQERLKRDLFEMGVFDHRMAIYLPCRMRDLAHYGFSGFEGRFYSLFPDLGETFAQAVNLQTLVCALACAWVQNGRIDHSHIPDDPHTESERRQIFFATAIGLPTVFVRADTGNRVLQRILGLVEHQRPSRRYRGMVRIELDSYRRACLALLRAEIGITGWGAAADEPLDRLEAILGGSLPTAAERLTAAILGARGRSSDPMRTEARAFNQAAEHYYRTTLCHRHMEDGLATLQSDASELDWCSDPAVAGARDQLTGGVPVALFVRATGRRVLAGEATVEELQTFILLTALIVRMRQATAPAAG